ncbi:MAG: hypothetical protein JXP73_00590 [Deltaproteobacteria bacterium]|jgi:hypothetical protein|nr:hypothetical protein [Deltaproteobacteria bacterium]
METLSGSLQSRPQRPRDARPSTTARVLVTAAKGVGSPPKDHNECKDFIKAPPRHCIGKYGMDDVPNWFWEVRSGRQLTCGSSPTCAADATIG